LSEINTQKSIKQMKTFQQFMEQTPHMEPNEYNKQVARRQASQKVAHSKHVHQELGAEARAQQSAKRAEMKTIMSR